MIISKVTLIDKEGVEKGAVINMHHVENIVWEEKEGYSIVTYRRYSQMIKEKPYEILKNCEELMVKN